MIKLLLSLILLILVLVFFWKNMFLNEPKKVRFADKEEKFEVPALAQPNDKNKNIQKLEKVYDQINPHNFYTQYYNTPNFNTNVLDVRKSFSYFLPPNSPEKSEPIPTEPYFLNPHPVPNVENFENNKKTDAFIKRANDENNPWYVKDKNTSSGLEYESDYWVYKNEMPMNGGMFGNIVGYENMGDSFSTFYTKNSMDIVMEQEKFLKRDDDLRNGMGTTQKQEYLYDMAKP